MILCQIGSLTFELFQIRDETKDQMPDEVGLMKQLVELFLINGFPIETQIEMRLKFGTRSQGDIQKPDKLFVALTAEPLSNVRHDRNRSSAKLVPKAQILLEW